MGKVRTKVVVKSMTPAEFVWKWAASGDLNEEQGAQHHFIDLCDLLDVPRPPTDRGSAEYSFERSFQGLTGKVRYADVWKKGCFAWEYKRPGKSLSDALDQLLRYAFRLDNPPLLVVTDRLKFEIHTHFTGYPTRRIEFSNQDLLDPRVRSQVRTVFLDPYSFKPERDARRVTEEVADSVVRVADMLRGAGIPSFEAAHFLCQYVFCCFAEDVGLMREDHRPFKRLLKQGLTSKQLQSRLRDLFVTMRKGGSFGADQIPWFNGGLFDSIQVPLLPAEAIQILASAAEDRWDAIDASIFGTLFQRGLDPAKRAQHGAFYTSPDIIERLVTPVVQNPLLVEWDSRKREISHLISMRDVHAIHAEHVSARARRYRIASKGKRARQDAQDLFNSFLERLKQFRVLDPACGSGNFLYLALKAIKDVEKQVHNDAADLGLSWQFAVTGVQNVLGIEVDPYAAELARMTVWIGELQWRKQNGYSPEQDPILRKLEHIECRDAVLGQGEGGRAVQADWPVADVIVGNPPFIGNKKMREDLGNEYTDAIRSAYRGELSSGVDFVCYWFHKALRAIAEGNADAAGLVSTQAVRRGSNRSVLEAICAHSRIFRAWSDEPWVNEGAAVRVSLVCFGKSTEKHSVLNGARVRLIAADLNSIEGVDLTLARPLIENSGIAFQGTTKVGPFEISGGVARSWLRLPNPNGRSNADVIRPWSNGQSIARRPLDEWIIDFGAEMSEREAMGYEAPYEYVYKNVRPQRLLNNRNLYKQYWWRHAESRSGMRRALSGLSRFLATPRVAKHRYFVWLNATTLPDSRLYAIAREDDWTFGVLSSRIHTVWAMANASRHGVGNDPTYNAGSCFETFPFPSFSERLETISRAAEQLNTSRECWLNPPELVESRPEVVPLGWKTSPFPKRRLVREGFEEQLAKRTLTALYNQQPQWLVQVHQDVDIAVAHAYGWDDYAPDMSGNEILDRLLSLNLERAKRQAGTQGELPLLGVVSKVADVLSTGTQSAKPKRSRQAA